MSSSMVVGAGIAGLACAKVLIKNGLESVSILEASDSIGGRISTLNVSEQPGTMVEFGAQWIHGHKANFIYHIAKDIGALHNDAEPCQYTPVFAISPALAVSCEHMVERDDGELCNVNSDFSSFLYKQYLSILSTCDKIYRENKICPTEDSVRNFVEKEFAAFCASNSIDGTLLTLAKAILRNLLIYETGVSGCRDMKEVSASQFGSYEELSDEDQIVHNGYQRIPESLAADITDHIYFGRRVSKIETHFEHDDVVTVHCDNGETFKADSVVVTCSLGHLKAHQDNLFCPQLPMEKSNAIAKLGFGVVDKIFLVYDNLDFIPIRHSHIHFLRHESELGSDWFYSVYALSVVQNSNRRILCGWITGDAALYMESLTDDVIMHDITCHVLEPYFGCNVPKPTAVYRSEWGNNDLTRGSYTFIPVGSSVEDIHSLAKPILNPRSGKPAILFAGEATHARYYSTTHGAYLSGETAAETLLSHTASRNEGKSPYCV